MENIKLVLKIVLKILLASIITFICTNLFFQTYLYIQNKKFTKTKVGMKIEQVREIVGKPDEITTYNGEIMEVYYYFPAAESRFFYSKKDSILTRNWRTDFD